MRLEETRAGGRWPIAQLVGGGSNLGVRTQAAAEQNSGGDRGTVVIRDQTRTVTCSCDEGDLPHFPSDLALRNMGGETPNMSLHLAWEAGMDITPSLMIKGVVLPSHLSPC